MSRQARIAPGDQFFHVMNRANGLTRLFGSSACYRDFLRVVDECATLDSMRILAYCAMPNHWHMLVWPRLDGDLCRFMHRLTIRHTKRLHMREGTEGRGHVYQARYKSVVVQGDDHLLTVCRYVERNPLAAGLVADAFDWPWSSAPARQIRSSDGPTLPTLVKLEPFPMEMPRNWRQVVNDAPGPETDDLRRRIKDGTPFGSDDWRSVMSRRLKIRLERKRTGRPRKS